MFKMWYIDFCLVCNSKWMKFYSAPVCSEQTVSGPEVSTFGSRCWFQRFTNTLVLTTKSILVKQSLHVATKTRLNCFMVVFRRLIKEKLHWFYTKLSNEVTWISVNCGWRWKQCENVWSGFIKPLKAPPRLCSRPEAQEHTRINFHPSSEDAYITDWLTEWSSYSPLAALSKWFGTNKECC